MRKRGLVVMGTMPLLGLAGGLLAMWLSIPTPGVTWENDRRLRPGMSDNEIEWILGKAAEASSKLIYYHKAWKGKEVVIYLCFDTDCQLLQGGAAYPVHALQCEPGIALLEIDQPSEAAAGWEPLQTGERFLDRVRRWLPW
jgi:hypothetical protein